MEIESGRVVSRFHGHATMPWNAWFTPDGSSVYSSGPDGTLQTWDPTTGAPELRVPFGGGVWWTTVTPDFSRAAVFALSGPTVKIFDLGPENRAAVMTYPRVTDCADPFYASHSLQVVGDRAVMMIVCGANDGEAVVFDVNSGAVIQTFPDVTGQEARLSPDGSLIAAQSAAEGPTFAETVVVYDVASGAVVATMSGLCTWDHVVGDDAGCALYPDQPFADWMGTIRFSPDGSMVAAVGAVTGAITVWDTGTGELLRTWNEKERIFGAEFTPDGTKLNFGMVSTLRVLDAADWSVTTTWDAVESGHGTAPGQHMESTSDGSTIATAAAAFWGVGDLLIFDASDMTLSRTIETAHDGGIRSLDISPDDTMVASVGLDGMARVHLIDSGELVTEIPVVIGAQANNLQFLDDETLIVTVGDRGLMYQLTLDEAVLLAVARDRLTRSFSDQECANYRIDPCPTLEEIRSG